VSVIAIFLGLFTSLPDFEYQKKLNATNMFWIMKVKQWSEQAKAGDLFSQEELK